MWFLGIFQALLQLFLGWLCPGLTLRSLRLHWRRGWLELRNLNVPASMTRYLPVRLPVRFVRLHVGRLRIKVSWRALRQLARWRVRSRHHGPDPDTRRVSLSFLSELLCIEIEDVGLLCTDDTEAYLESRLERALWKRLQLQLKLAKLQECERLAARVLQLPVMGALESGAAWDASLDAEGNEGQFLLEDARHRPGNTEAPDEAVDITRNARADPVSNDRCIVTTQVPHESVLQGSVSTDGACSWTAAPVSSSAAPDGEPAKQLVNATQSEALEASRRTHAHACTPEHTAAAAAAAAVPNAPSMEDAPSRALASTLEPSDLMRSSNVVSDHGESTVTADAPECTARQHPSAEATREAPDSADASSSSVGDELREPQLPSDTGLLASPAATSEASTEPHDAPQLSETGASGIATTTGTTEALALDWDAAPFLEIFERSSWIQVFRQVRIRLRRVWIRLEASPQPNGKDHKDMAPAPYALECSLEDAYLEPPDEAFRAQVLERCGLSLPELDPSEDASYEESVFLWRGCCFRGLRIRFAVDDERWLPLLAQTPQQSRGGSASDEPPLPPLQESDWDWLWRRLRHREPTSYLIADLLLLARLGINMAAFEDTTRYTMDALHQNSLPFAAGAGAGAGAAAAAAAADTTTIRLHASIPYVHGHLTLATLLSLTRLAEQLAHWFWRAYLHQKYDVPAERPRRLSPYRLARLPGRRHPARAWWRYAVRCVLGLRRRQRREAALPAALPELSRWLRLQLLYFALYRELVYGESAPKQLFECVMSSLDAVGGHRVCPRENNGALRFRSVSQPGSGLNLADDSETALPRRLVAQLRYLEERMPLEQLLNARLLVHVHERAKRLQAEAANEKRSSSWSRGHIWRLASTSWQWIRSTVSSWFGAYQLYQVVKQRRESRRALRWIATATEAASDGSARAEHLSQALVTQASMDSGAGARAPVSAATRAPATDVSAPASVDPGAAAAAGAVGADHQDMDEFLQRLRDAFHEAWVAVFGESGRDAVLFTESLVEAFETSVPLDLEMQLEQASWTLHGIGDSERLPGDLPSGTRAASMPKNNNNENKNKNKSSVSASLLTLRLQGIWWRLHDLGTTSPLQTQVVVRDWEVIPDVVRVHAQTESVFYADLPSTAPSAALYMRLQVQKRVDRRNSTTDALPLLHENGNGGVPGEPAAPGTAQTPLQPRETASHATGCNSRASSTETESASALYVRLQPLRVHLQTEQLVPLLSLLQEWRACIPRSLAERIAGLMQEHPSRARHRAIEALQLEQRFRVDVFCEWIQVWYASRWLLQLERLSLLRTRSLVKAHFGEAQRDEPQPLLLSIASMHAHFVPQRRGSNAAGRNAAASERNEQVSMSVHPHDAGATISLLEPVPLVLKLFGRLERGQNAAATVATEPRLHIVVSLRVPVRLQLAPVVIGALFEQVRHWQQCWMQRGRRRPWLWGRVQDTRLSPEMRSNAPVWQQLVMIPVVWRQRLATQHAWHRGESALCLGILGMDAAGSLQLVDASADRLSSIIGMALEFPCWQLEPLHDPLPWPLERASTRGAQLLLMLLRRSTDERPAPVIASPEHGRLGAPESVERTTDSAQLQGSNETTQTGATTGPRADTNTPVSTNARPSRGAAHASSASSSTTTCTASGAVVAFALRFASAAHAELWYRRWRCGKFEDPQQQQHYGWWALLHPGYRWCSRSDTILGAVSAGARTPVLSSEAYPPLLAAVALWIQVEMPHGAVLEMPLGRWTNGWHPAGAHGVAGTRKSMPFSRNADTTPLDCFEVSFSSLRLQLRSACTTLPVDSALVRMEQLSIRLQTRTSSGDTTAGGGTPLIQIPAVSPAATATPQLAVDTARRALWRDPRWRAYVAHDGLWGFADGPSLRTWVSTELWVAFRHPREAPDRTQGFVLIPSVSLLLQSTWMEALIQLCSQIMLAAGPSGELACAGIQRSTLRSSDSPPLHATGAEAYAAASVPKNSWSNRQQRSHMHWQRVRRRLRCWRLASHFWVLLLERSVPVNAPPTCSQTEAERIDAPAAQHSSFLGRTNWESFRQWRHRRSRIATTATASWLPRSTSSGSSPTGCTTTGPTPEDRANAEAAGGADAAADAAEAIATENAAAARRCAAETTLGDTVTDPCAGMMLGAAPEERRCGDALTTTTTEQQTGLDGTFQMVLFLAEALVAMRSVSEELGIFAELLARHLDLECCSEDQSSLQLTMKLSGLALRDLLSLRSDTGGELRFYSGTLDEQAVEDESPTAGRASSGPMSLVALSSSSSSSRATLRDSLHDATAEATLALESAPAGASQETSCTRAALEVHGVLGLDASGSSGASKSSSATSELEQERPVATAAPTSARRRRLQLPEASLRTAVVPGLQLRMMVNAPEIVYFHPFYALLVQTVYAWRDTLAMVSACQHVQPPVILGASSPTDETSAAAVALAGAVSRKGSARMGPASSSALPAGISDTGQIPNTATAMRLPVHIEIHCIQPRVCFPSELHEASFVEVKLETARLRLEQTALSSPVATSVSAERPFPMLGDAIVASYFEAQTEEVSVFCRLADEERVAVCFLEPVPLLEASIYWTLPTGKLDTGHQVTSPTMGSSQTASENAGTSTGIRRAVTVPGEIPTRSSQTAPPAEKRTEQRSSPEPVTLPLEVSDEPVDVTSLVLQAQAAELECHLSPTVIAALELVLLTNLLRSYGQRCFPVSSYEPKRITVELSFERCLLFADATDPELEELWGSSGNVNSSDSTTPLQTETETNTEPAIDASGAVRDTRRSAEQAPSVSSSTASAFSASKIPGSITSSVSEARAPVALPGETSSLGAQQRRYRSRKPATSEPGRNPVSASASSLGAANWSSTGSLRSMVRERSESNESRPVLHSRGYQDSNTRTRTASDTETVPAQVLMDCRDFRGVFALTLPSGASEGHFTLSELQLWSRRDQAERTEEQQDVFAAPTSRALRKPALASSVTLSGSQTPEMAATAAWQLPSATPEAFAAQPPEANTPTLAQHTRKTRWRQTRTGMVLCSGPVSLDLGTQPGHPFRWRFETDKSLQLTMRGISDVAVLEVLTVYTITLGQTTKSLRPYLRLHDLSVESLFGTSGWDMQLELPRLELLLLDQRTFGATMLAGVGIELAMHAALKLSATGKLERLVSGVQEVLFFRAWLAQQAAPKQNVWHGGSVYDIQCQPYFASIVVERQLTSPRGHEASSSTIQVQLLSEELELRFGVDDLVLCLRTLDGLLNTLFQRLQTARVRRAWYRHRLALRSAAFVSRASGRLGAALLGLADTDLHHRRFSGSIRSSYSAGGSGAPSIDQERDSEHLDHGARDTDDAEGHAAGNESTGAAATARHLHQRGSSGRRPLGLAAAAVNSGPLKAWLSERLGRRRTVPSAKQAQSLDVHVPRRHAVDAAAAAAAAAATTRGIDLEAGLQAKEQQSFLDQSRESGKRRTLASLLRSSLSMDSDAQSAPRPAERIDSTSPRSPMHLDGTSTTPDTGATAGATAASTGTPEQTIHWQGSIGPIRFSLMDTFAQVPYALVSLALCPEDLEVTWAPDQQALGVTVHLRMAMHTFASDRLVWDPLVDPFNLWIRSRSQINQTLDTMTLGVAIEVPESIECTVSDRFIQAIAQTDQRIRHEFAMEHRQLGRHRQLRHRQRAWVRWTRPRSEPQLLELYNATELVLCLETQLQLVPLQLAPGARVALPLVAPLPSTCCWYPADDDRQRADAAFRARLWVQDATAAAASCLTSPWTPAWLNLSHYGRQLLRLQWQAGGIGAALAATDSIPAKAAAGAAAGAAAPSLELLMIGALRGEQLTVSFHSPVLVQNTTGTSLRLRLRVPGGSPVPKSASNKPHAIEVRSWYAHQFACYHQSRKADPTPVPKTRHRATDEQPAGVDCWQRAAWPATAATLDASSTAADSQLAYASLDVNQRSSVGTSAPSDEAPGDVAGASYQRSGVDRNRAPSQAPCADAATTGTAIAGTGTAASTQRPGSASATPRTRSVDTQLVLETVIPPQGVRSLPLAFSTLDGELYIQAYRRPESRVPANACDSSGVSRTPAEALDSQSSSSDALRSKEPPPNAPLEMGAFLRATQLEPLLMEARHSAVCLPLYSETKYAAFDTGGRANAGVAASQRRVLWYARMQAFRMRSDAWWLALSILPVVKVLNALPYPATLDLLQDGQRTGRLSLASGAEDTITGVNWMRPWLMEWSVREPDDTYKCRVPSVFTLEAPRSLPDASQSYWDGWFRGQQTNALRCWRLQLAPHGDLDRSSARWLLTLTASYWLLNFTNIALDVLPLNPVPPATPSADRSSRWCWLSSSTKKQRPDVLGEVAAELQAPCTRDAATRQPTHELDTESPVRLHRANATVAPGVPGYPEVSVTAASSQGVFPALQAALSSSLESRSELASGAPQQQHARTAFERGTEGLWMLSLTSTAPAATMANRARFAVQASLTSDRHQSRRQRRFAGGSVDVRYQTLGRSEFVLDGWPLVIHRQPHWELTGVTLVSLHPYLLIQNASTFAVAVRALHGSSAAVLELPASAGSEASGAFSVRPLRLWQHGRGRSARSWLSRPVLSLAVREDRCEEASAINWHWYRDLPLKEDRVFTLSFIMEHLLLASHLGAQRVQLVERPGTGGSTGLKSHSMNPHGTEAEQQQQQQQSCSRLETGNQHGTKASQPVGASRSKARLLESNVDQRRHQRNDDPHKQRYPTRYQEQDQAQLGTCRQGELPDTKRHQHWQRSSSNESAHLREAFECLLHVQVSSNLLGQKIVILSDELPTSPRFALWNRTPYVILYRWMPPQTLALGGSLFHRRRCMFQVARPYARLTLSPAWVTEHYCLQAMAFASLREALEWRLWRHGQVYDLMEPQRYAALPVQGQAGTAIDLVYPQVDLVGTGTAQLVFSSTRHTAATATTNATTTDTAQHTSTSAQARALIETSFMSAGAQASASNEVPLLGAFLHRQRGAPSLEILLQVELKRAAVSLVLCDSHQRFFEMLYAAASGMELFLHTCGPESSLSLQVTSVQCDNTLPFYVSPVLMLTREQPWLSCAARWRQHAGGRHYYSIQLRIAELLVMLDDGLLWRLLEAARELWSSFSQRRAGLERTAPVLRSVLEAVDAPSLWLASSRAVAEQRRAPSFFQLVRVERMRLRLSFKTDRERALETAALTRQTLFNAGLVLTELDNALVLVGAFQLRQVYAPLAQVIERMVQHVLWQSFLSSYNFIGGLSWLGDPAGWLYELREGTFDFFNEPISGLFESNEALWRGFRRGAFAQGQALTFALTQPAAQLAGSLARALGTISLNRTFEIARARQDRTLGEPEDIFLGIAYGMLGAGTALGAALTGIFVEPVRGYRQSGVGGLFQGLVAGLWGWLPLTLASFLVLVQKLAMGIRNQNRVDLRTRERLRDPRVLYRASDAPLPPYVAYLARGQRLLHQVQRGALATEPYVIHIEFEMSALEDREEEEARDSSMEATQRPSVWGAVSRRRLIGWISKGRLASSLGKNPGAAGAAAGAGAGAQETLITVAVPAAVILSRSYLVAVDGNGAFLWRCRLARIEAIRERSDPTGIRWLWIQARPRRGRSRRAYLFSKPEAAASASAAAGGGGAVVMTWAALPTRPPSPSLDAFMQLVSLMRQRQASMEAASLPPSREPSTTRATSTNKAAAETLTALETDILDAV